LIRLILLFEVVQFAKREGPEMVAKPTYLLFEFAETIFDPEPP
jgi:hypothetical protein